jgi:hypothetical protein
MRPNATPPVRISVVKDVVPSCWAATPPIHIWRSRVPLDCVGNVVLCPGETRENTIIKMRISIVSSREFFPALFGEPAKRHPRVAQHSLFVMSCDYTINLTLRSRFANRTVATDVFPVPIVFPCSVCPSTVNLYAIDPLLSCNVSGPTFQKDKGRPIIARLSGFVLRRGKGVAGRRTARRRSRYLSKADRTTTPQTESA